MCYDSINGSLLTTCHTASVPLAAPPFPRRVVIRADKANADTELAAGQLGVVSKVEHSTSGIEVQVPSLGNVTLQLQQQYLSHVHDPPEALKATRSVATGAWAAKHGAKSDGAYWSSTIACRRLVGGYFSPNRSVADAIAAMPPRLVTSSAGQGMDYYPLLSPLSSRKRSHAESASGLMAVLGSPLGGAGGQHQQGLLQVRHPLTRPRASSSRNEYPHAFRRASPRWWARGCGR